MHRPVIPFQIEKLKSDRKQVKASSCTDGETSWSAAVWKFSALLKVTLNRQNILASVGTQGRSFLYAAIVTPPPPHHPPFPLLSK